VGSWSRIRYFWVNLQVLAVLNGLVILSSASPVPTPTAQYNQQYFQPTPRRVIEPQPSASSNYPQVAVQKRQTGYGYPSPTQSQQELDTAAQSLGDGSFARPTQPSGFGGGGGGRPGGNGNVRCQRIGGGGGDSYRFQCEVVRKEDITLKYEHILWLAGGSNGAPAVEIVVPNYRVEEIIKAGFKGGQVGGKQPINILLQRPEKTVAAEVDVPKQGQIEPEVNIQYEAPTNTQVHYPNDQAYRPLSGPILPPSRNWEGTSGAGENPNAQWNWRPSSKFTSIILYEHAALA